MTQPILRIKRLRFVFSGRCLLIFAWVCSYEKQSKSRGGEYAAG